MSFQGGLELMYVWKLGIDRNGWLAIPIQVCMQRALRNDRKWIGKIESVMKSQEASNVLKPLKYRVDHGTTLLL